MSGALMQLVAFGAQDAYLFGNPQISFFKLVYRRHTNFATEVSEIAFNSGNNNIGGKHNVDILRNGDLIMQMYLHASFNAIRGKSAGAVAWCRRLGHALIKYVEIKIGGATIDKQYGTWLDIWYELSHTDTMERGYRKMIGDIPEITELSTGVLVDDKSEEKIFKDEFTLFVPLNFWFCRNPGLALPLIALQYHEVRLEFEFRNAKELICHTTNFNTDLIKNLTFKDLNLIVNYVYLDSDERRKFAQNGHEYLIEQVQHTGSYNIPGVVAGLTGQNQNVIQNIDLNFNHPTKELVWVMKNGNYNSGHKFLGYTGSDNWQEALDYAAYNVVNHAFIVNEPALYTSPASQAIWQRWLGLGVDLLTYPEFLNIYQPITSGLNILSTTSGHLIKCMVNTDGLIDEYFGLRNNVIGYFYRNCAKIGNYDILDKIDEIEINFSITNRRDITTSSGSYVLRAADIYAVAVPTRHHISIRDISIPISQLPHTWRDFKIPNRYTNFNDVVVWNHTNYGLLIDGSVNPIHDVVIQFNGHDRFDRREGSYFNYVQPYEHHTRTPADGINVYSFALNPEQFQPSGTANFSRIDNLRININYRDTTIPNGNTSMPALSAFSPLSKFYIYDVNYNVLRVLSGMGGLAYSN